jgi:glycosyltransferase AglE
MKPRGFPIVSCRYEAPVNQVSVIVPVRNNPAGLEALLHALLSQTCPREAYQVIVVDNGSRDGTRDVARAFEARYPGVVRLLVENTVANSYAARNMGLRAALGSVIAMTDSDCVPVPAWIEAGLEALTHADLVGGKVTLGMPPQPGPADMYDQLIHFRHEHTVPERGAVATANLFVKRSVFDALGPFPTYVSSGVDAIWTSAATRAGFKLSYAPQAEVVHPTRGFSELMRKQYRLGGGQPAIWRSRGRSWPEVLWFVARGMLPVRFGRIRRMIRERGTPAMAQKIWSIWVVAWLCRLVTNLGRVQGFLRLGRAG